MVVCISPFNPTSKLAVICQLWNVFTYPKTNPGRMISNRTICIIGKNLQYNKNVVWSGIMLIAGGRIKIQIMNCSSTKNIKKLNYLQQNVTGRSIISIEIPLVQSL